MVPPSVRRQRITRNPVEFGDGLTQRHNLLNHPHSMPEPRTPRLAHPAQNAVARDRQLCRAAASEIHQIGGAAITRDIVKGERFTRQLLDRLALEGLVHSD